MYVFYIKYLIIFSFLSNIFFKKNIVNIWDNINLDTYVSLTRPKHEYVYEFLLGRQLFSNSHIHLSYANPTQGLS